MTSKPRLTGSKLSALAKRMAEESVPAKVAQMRKAILRSFYGGKRIRDEKALV